MDDSNAGGQSGEGNIHPRRIISDTRWGDLPAEDRAAILQDLSQDLPAHFREVIEAYFRKLARDDAS